MNLDIIYRCILCGCLKNFRFERIITKEEIEKKSEEPTRFTYCKSCREYIDWEDEQYPL